jgi:hypothetical protein
VICWLTWQCSENQPDFEKKIFGKKHLRTMFARVWIIRAKQAWISRSKHIIRYRCRTYCTPHVVTKCVCNHTVEIKKPETMDSKISRANSTAFLFAKTTTGFLFYVPLVACGCIMAPFTGLIGLIEGDWHGPIGMVIGAVSWGVVVSTIDFFT